MAETPVIAVVNNDPVFIRLMDTLLTDGGFSVVTYPPSDAGPDAIARARPAAVLLDTWMRYQGDGWELVQSLRGDPRTEMIPILLCSSESRELREKGPDLQAEEGIAMLAKPFDPDTLLEKVNQILKR